MTSPQSRHNLPSRAVAALLVALQAVMPLLYTNKAWADSAAITPDRSVSGQRPVVNVAGNGVPVVQIAPPNAAGVSHNRYTEYNVGTAGAILNNSGASSQTQLGGWVSGNPMLGNSSARTIINEVTGSASSRLNGYTEVAGNRANVVVANPNGISCNGCGFINAARATLTTGTPQFGSDGSLTGFDVRRGQIDIDGSGLNASGADQLDLISRSLRVNAGIWATRLEIASGANQVDYSSGAATAQSGTGDAPTVAIDASQLGSMYANSIRMVGTEAGVGVNTAGNIAALTGDIQLNAAGDLRITGGLVQAKGNATLQSNQAIANAGTVYAEGNASISAGTSLQNTNLIVAAGNVQAQAASVANSGSVAAGVNSQGSVALPGSVTLAATGTLQNSGQLLAGTNVALGANAMTLDSGYVSATGQVSAGATGAISHRGATMSADSATLDSGAGFDNTGGALQSRTLTLSATKIDNTSGTILQLDTSGQLSLNTQQEIVNTGGRIAANATSMNLSASRIDNQGGSIQHAGTGTLTVQATGALNNVSGAIAGNGAASISAQSIDNTAGSLQAQGDATVSGTTAINNAGGAILAGGALSTTTQGALTNTSGTVQGAQITVQAASMSNGAGQIQQTGTGNTAITVTGALDNATGAIGSNGAAFTLTAASLNNNSGSILHAGSGDATVTVSGALNNTDGRIAGSGTNATISAQGLDNTRGRIDHTGSGTLTVHGGATFTNTSGVVDGNASAVIAAGTIINAASTVSNASVKGTITARATLGISATTALNNDGGVVQSDGALDVTTPALTNDGGTVLSNQTATIAADNLDNRRGAISGDRLSVTSISLQNTSGQMVSLGNGAASINASGSLNNNGGAVAGNGNLTVGGDSIANQGGTIQAANGAALAVNATNAVDNSSSGKIASAGAMTLQAGSVNNGTGQVTAGTTLAINANGSLNNAQGTIAATGNATLSGGQIINTSGVIGSVQGSLTSTSTAATDNTGGRFEAAEGVTLTAVGLTNSQGVISGNDTSINASSQALDNAGGTINARGTLTVSSGQLTNNAGLIQASGALSVNTNGQTLTNQQSGTSGGIIGQSTVTLTSGNLTNQGGFIGSVGAMTVTAGQVSNSSSSSIVSQGNLNVTATGLDNSTSTLQVQGDLTVDLGAGTLNNSGSLMRSGGTLTASAGTITNANTSSSNQGLEGVNVALTAPTINNTSGAIRADNQLNVTSTGTLNNTSGLVSSTNAATINATNITNTSGTLIADSNLNVTATNLSGDGKLLSRGDMTVTLAGSFNNSSQVQATNNLTLTSQGTVTNSGLINAGNTLNLTAAALTNQSAGEVSATNTNVNISGAVNNAGLIDGTNTQITAGSITNTGRIYGTQLALQAGTITNSSTGVIAARNSLNIGATNLTNQSGAIIYSAGSMNIGGSLSGGVATGSASSVLNASSTIEAGGAMSIAASSLTNRNDNFTTTTQTTGSTAVSEYQPSGWTSRLASSSVGFSSFDSGRLVTDSATYPIATFGVQLRDAAVVIDMNSLTVTYTYTNSDPIWTLFGITPPTSAPAIDWLCLDSPNNPGCDAQFAAYQAWQTDFNTKTTALDTAIAGFNTDLRSRFTEDWYAYNYTRTTAQSVTLTSDPAELLAGGSMTLTGAVTNDKSQIIAGGSLNTSGASLNNIDAQGTSTSTDSGTVQFTELVSCGFFGDSHCRNWGTPGAYNPAPTVTTTSLSIATVQQNTPNGNGLAISNVNNGSVSQSATGASNASTSIAGAQNIGSVASIAALVNATGAVGSPIQTVAIPAVAGQGVNAISFVVRTSVPSLTIPSNALFRTHTEPGVNYLVETDPRFANYRTWLSSDFMLTQLSLDPSATLKRLGDGFYEQKLIADQIMLATGQRFVGNYTSNEAEYQGLMQSGVAFAQSYHLTVGVALTPAQMQLLTTDIVWLVQQTVTLPDGSRQTVLVPQVYVHVRDGDLKGDGTLIAANDINLNVTGNFNNSATIGSRSVAQITADNINNIGGRIQGTSVTLAAQTDLNNLSGIINGNTVSLSAGRDINLQSNTVASVGGTGTRANIDRIATVYGGNVSVQAGRDLTIAGAQVGATGDVVLTANRNVTIGTVASVNSLDLAASGYIREKSVQNTGSLIATGGNLTIGAGLAQNGNLTIRGSQIDAGGDLTAAATNVTIQGAVDSRDVAQRTELKHGSLTIDEHAEGLVSSKIGAGGQVLIAAAGTTTGGKIDAGTGELTVQGSNVTSTAGNIALAANNIKVGEQTLNQRRDTASEYHQSGLFSSTNATGQDHVQSTQSVGSTISGDSVSLAATNDITLRAANVVGTNNVTLAAGNNITIAAAQNTSSESHQHEEKTSGIFGSGTGLTLGSKEQQTAATSTSVQNIGSTVGSVSGNVSINAGNAYTQTASKLVAPTGDIGILAKTVDINAAIDTGSSTYDERNKQSGLSVGISSPVIEAAQTVGQMARSAGDTQDPRMKALAAGTAGLSIYNAAQKVATDGVAGSASISISIGSSQNESSQRQSSTTVVGSSIDAGRDVSIVATGAGADSNINVVASDIRAARNATVIADGQVNLLAGQSTSDLHSTNSSSGASIGVGISFTGGKVAAGVTVSAQSGRGNADGSDVSYTNSRIVAGDTATLVSGGDTTLKGGIIAANTVNADIGGDLKVESLQDTSSYTSRQSSMGGSVTFGPAPGASISASKSNIDSTFASVQEQSGIKAGDGGYNVNVAANTDLKGGVIAASDKAIAEGKINFSTGGTLTQSDITNTASYNANSAGISFGVGTPSAGVGFGKDGGDASSVTKSGVGVSTSTDTTAALKPIFDANRVQKEIDAQVQITQAFSREAPKAVGTYANSKLQEARIKRKQAETEPDPEKKAALTKEADDLEANWKEGGLARVLLHTAVGAAGGDLKGALGAAVSAGAAPYLNDMQASIQQSLQDSGMDVGTAKAIAQGVTALTAAGMGAAVGGAQGAGTALAADVNNRALHEERKAKVVKAVKAKTGENVDPDKITARMLFDGEAATLQQSKVSGVSGTYNPDAVVSEMQAVGRCSAYTDCLSQLQSAGVAPGNNGAIFITSPNSTNTVNYQVALQFLGTSFENWLNAPGNEANLYEFQARISNSKTGLVDLSDYYHAAQALATQNMMREAGFDSGATTLGDKTIQTIVNALNFAAKGREAAFFNTCSDCPQSMQDRPNLGLLMVDIALSGTIAKDVGVLSARGIGVVAEKSATLLNKDILFQGKNSFDGLGNATTSPWLSDSRAGVRVAIEEFRDGGSFLVPKSIYDNLFAGRNIVGRTDGQFMISKSSMDRLLAEANGDIAVVKQKLGVPAGAWNEPLVRVDVMNPLLHNARLPSGLNSGANSQFQWGGYTSGGLPEIITNPVPIADVRATTLSGVK